MSMLLIFILLGALGDVCFAQEAEYRPRPVQSSHSFSKSVHKDLKLNYLLYLPDAYSNDGDSWPLVLFLHGAGERGDDLERVKTHGPPMLVERGEKIPAIVVSPQCPANSWWIDHLEALSYLVDGITRGFRVDEDRIYVTGLSMGGDGAWALAALLPEKFAAAMPISAGGANRISAVRLRKVAIWAFHGEADPVVPAAEPLAMVENITRFGGNVRLTVYPGVGHDSWTPTYEDPAVWEWLLSQRGSR